jgi:hypothetical protein
MMKPMAESSTSEAFPTEKTTSLKQSPDILRRVEILFTIMDSGKGGEVVESLRECGVTYNLMAVGYGASARNLTDFLGFSSDFEKDVVLSIVTEDRVHEVLSMLHYKFDIDKPDHGIAFTIPIAGVSGPLALRYISGPA